MITVGLPIYNASCFLREAIDSILSQTYPDFELLIVNDGSTDDSIDVVNSFDDPRIRLINDKQNRGLAARLNQISKLAVGDYLVRMDADDIMHPERLEKQLAILENNPNVDVLGTNAYSINRESIVVGMRLRLNENPGLFPTKSFIHPTIMARTTWFRENSYNEKAIRIEDAELWFRTSRKFSFMVYHEPLLFYREFGKDYYKKYFYGLPGISFCLKKYWYSPKWFAFCVKYIASGVKYYIYNVFNMEGRLILKRNQIVFKKEERKNYKTYI